MNEPAQPPSGSQPNVAVSPPPVTTAKRVLLIEDKAEARLLFLEKLRKAGFAVDVAPNGRLALEKLKRRCPDAIFMDLLLPTVKGVDVIKEARQHPKFAGRPIYVCTSAGNMKAWTRRGTKAGATKVFDRAHTPIDQIVAEIAAEVIGTSASGDASSAGSGEKTESETLPHPPGETNASTAPSGGLVQPRTQPSEAPAGKSSGARLTFVQRLLKPFRRAETDTAPIESATFAPPVRLAPAREPIASQPGSDLGQTAAASGVFSPPLEPQSQPRDASARPFDGIDGPSAGGVAAVFTLDDTGTIVCANEGCSAMFGYESSAMVGQNVRMLVKENSGPELEKLLAPLPAGTPTQTTREFSMVARSKDGREFPAIITAFTWSSDTALIRRNDKSHFTFTAIFREAPAGAASEDEVARGLNQERPVSAGPLPEELSRLEESLAATQRANLELTKHCEAISAEATKQRQALAKSEQERAELERRIASNTQELQHAQTTLEQERNELQQLEQKLQGFAATKAELEKQLADESRSKEDLLRSSAKFRAQLGEAQAGAAQAEQALKEKNAQCSRAEEELAKLRKGRDDLNARLMAEQKAAAESRRRAEESDTRLLLAVHNLDGVKADADKHSTERDSLERALGEQLNAAKAAAERADAALKEQVLRNQEFEKRQHTLSNSLRQEQAERGQRFSAEVARHRQESDQLRDKLTAEHQAAEESRLRVQELESRLLENARESEHTKAELKKQAAEQKRLDSEWREKLSSTEEAAFKLKAACAEAEERNQRFQKELAALRTARDELTEKLTAEQAVTADSQKRIDELEDCLRQNSTELKHVTAELEKAKGDERFKMELASLYQMRDLLDDKLTKEKRATAAAGQRVAQFEDRLRDNAAELERLHADQNKQSDAHALVESKLAAQRDAARTAAEQTAAALKEKAAQCSQFELKLTALQQARAELDSKLAADQQAADQARQRGEELENRLRESTAELERVKADLNKQVAEQERREHELLEQLDVAKAAAERAEAVLQEESARNRGFEERLRVFGNSLRLEQAAHTKRFEDNLARLRRERDELSARLKAGEQESAGFQRRGDEAEHRLRETVAELQRVKLDLDQQAQAQKRLESELRGQLEGTNAAAQQADAARKEESGRSGRLEQELAALQQERDKLNGKLRAGQDAAAESSRRVQELENHLRESAAQLARAKADFETQAAERTRLESARLNVAETRAAQQADAARKEESGRSGRLGQELAALQQERDKLNGKLRAGQDAAAESSRRVQELENHLRESAAQLARAKADFETQAAERTRLESARPTVAETRKESDKEPRGSREQEPAHPAEIFELDGRLRQAIASLARVTAELENERNERRRSEQRAATLAAQLQELHGHLGQHLESGSLSQSRIGAFENQLRDQEHTIARLRADLEKETTERQLAEEQLRASGAMSTQLQSCLSAFDQARKSFKRRQDELDLQLQGHQNTLAESQARLEKEILERKRAEEALGALQRNLQEQSQKSAGELSKLQSELSRLQSALDVEQAERKRLEGDAIQSRYGSLDSARVGLTTVNRFRKEMQEPVDHLMQSTRRLLEVRLEEQHKLLVESMLEDTLMLQTSLHETESS